MKKWRVVLGILLMTGFLTACGNATVAGESSEQKESISEEITGEVADEAMTESEAESVSIPEPVTVSGKTEVSGSFTVTVREILPDYVLDDFTPNMAVVTEFQCSPFMMYVGEEIGSKLQVGTTYVFTIEPTTLDFSINTINQMDMCSIVWFLDIVDVRLAGEDEIGLASLQLTFTEVKE